MCLFFSSLLLFFFSTSRSVRVIRSKPALCCSVQPTRNTHTSPTLNVLLDYVRLLLCVRSSQPISLSFPLIPFHLILFLHTLLPFFNGVRDCSLQATTKQTKKNIHLLIILFFNWNLYHPFHPSTYFFALPALISFITTSPS